MKKAWDFILQTLKVFVLFMACTVLFYYGMMWLQKEYEGNRIYERPDGSAIAVNLTNESSQSWFDTVKERFVFFYYNGE